MLNTVSVCCELNFSKLLPHSELKYTFFFATGRDLFILHVWGHLVLGSLTQFHVEDDLFEAPLRGTNYLKIPLKDMS